MSLPKGRTNNPNGRPRVPEIQQLRDAIAQVEKKQGKKLLVHFVEQAFVDNTTLAVLAKKILPDKMENDINLASDIKIIINPVPAHQQENK